MQVVFTVLIIGYFEENKGFLAGRKLGNALAKAGLWKARLAKNISFFTGDITTLESVFSFLTE